MRGRQGFPVTAGRSYALSSMQKTVSATGATPLMAVYWYNAGGTEIGWSPGIGTELAPGTPDWTWVNGTVIAPTGAVSARVHFRVETTGGTAYIDGVLMQ